MAEPITVAIVDDHPMMREALTMLVELRSQLALAGVAETGAAGVALIEATRPQVAIVDLQLPDFNGIEVTSRVLSSVPETNVLILTALDDRNTLRRCLKAGATGFLTKTASATEIVAAIESVADGTPAIDPLLLPHLVQHFVTEAATQPQFSERELSVLNCVAHGLSNTEIAERLFITPATAKTYVSRLRIALGANSRAHLVVKAQELAPADPDPETVR